MYNNIKLLSSGKNENKLYTFLGGFAGLILATLLCLWIAQSNDTTGIVPLMAFGFPCGGVVLGNLLGKRRKEDVAENNDSWNEIETAGKVRKSRFNNPYEELEMTPLGITVTVIFSYLTIYLSEVLNIAITTKKSHPEMKFMDLFIDIATNIFKVDWARKYLVEYWIFLTVFMVIFVVAVLWGMKKKKRMIEDEIERRKKY